MSADTDAFENHIKLLSPEILLKIFLNLNSHETVILRSVCQEFLEVIDNNKSLWRILDWKQQDEESPIPALKMFDEKSASTLKGVSIIQSKGGEVDARVLGVLVRSKNSLTVLSLTIRRLTPGVRLKMIELASNSHFLQSLVLWCTQEYWLSNLPKTRLTRSSRQSYLSTERSFNLQVLWCLGLVQEWNGKLDVSSLVSFADTIQCGSLKLRSFISNFSTTLVHLSINSVNDLTTPSLSCPSLRILEGRFYYGFPSWIDAPNLQIVIAQSIDPDSFYKLPICVEELWLLNWVSWASHATGNLDLSQVCPWLKVVKLGKDFLQNKLQRKNVLETFRVREEKVAQGVEIGGIKMTSLEKLILPIDLLKSAEVEQLRGLAGEVIDIKKHSDFIELEY